MTAWNPQAEMGNFVLGCLDVVFAFSLALERRGLLQRAEIVEMLEQVQSQAAAQPGGPTTRTEVARLIREAFDMPVAGAQARARLRLVDR
jgi:hypothetical protein